MCGGGERGYGKAWIGSLPILRSLNAIALHPGIGTHNVVQIRARAKIGGMLIEAWGPRTYVQRGMMLGPNSFTEIQLTAGNAVDTMRKQTSSM